MRIFSRLRQRAGILWRGRPSSGVCSSDSGALHPPAPSTEQSRSAAELRGKQHNGVVSCARRDSRRRLQATRKDDTQKKILREVKTVNANLQKLTPDGQRRAALAGEVGGTAFACAAIRGGFDKIVESMRSYQPYAIAASRLPRVGSHKLQMSPCIKNNSVRLANNLSSLV